MHQGQLWLQELQARVAREERLQLHQHLRAVQEAEHARRGANPVRRRLGGTLVRLGQRVAGDNLGSPVLTG